MQLTVICDVLLDSRRRVTKARRVVADENIGKIFEVAYLLNFAPRVPRTPSIFLNEPSVILLSMIVCRHFYAPGQATPFVISCVLLGIHQWLHRDRTETVVLRCSDNYR